LLSTLRVGQLDHMSVRTRSEILFEKLCAETGIVFTPIPPEPGAGLRTPDYELHLQVPPILAEVKQIDPNPEDKALLRQLQETGVYEFEGVPGKRQKNLGGGISAQGASDAKPARTADPLQQVDVLRGFTDPLQMMSAMYGLHEVVFTTSHSPAAQLLSASRRLGGSRRLTPKHNTTVSAVAVLFEGPEGPYLVVYHNRFASNPIPPGVLWRPRILQRSIRDVARGKFPEWVEL
jgi:hypothetical protein